MKIKDMNNDGLVLMTCELTGWFPDINNVNGRRYKTYNGGQDSNSQYYYELVREDCVTEYLSNGKSCDFERILKKAMIPDVYHRIVKNMITGYLQI